MENYESVFLISYLLYYYRASSSVIKVSKIRHFDWQREATISFSFSVARPLFDNTRPNPRQLNPKGSILHHVTHASSLSHSWCFSHVDHWSVSIRLSHWRSEALTMLGRETGQVVCRAVRPSVAFDKDEGVLVYSEVIVIWGHYTLLTITCSSSCCH